LRAHDVEQIIERVLAIGPAALEDCPSQRRRRTALQLRAMTDGSTAVQPLAVAYFAVGRRAARLAASDWNGPISTERQPQRAAAS
jgi:hypothetical protein